MKILPPLLPGLEPETFRSRVWRPTTELSPFPCFPYFPLELNHAPSKLKCKKTKTTTTTKTTNLK